MATEADLKDKVDELRAMGANIVYTHKDRNDDDIYEFRLKAPGINPEVKTFITPDEAIVYIDSLIALGE